METLTSEDVIRTWREELLGYIAEMGRFKDGSTPIEILRTLSGYSARATYMNNQIGSSKNRRLTDFKFEEIVPFLKETDFQFRVWSRIASITTSEWEMTK